MGTSGGGSAIGLESDSESFHSDDSDSGAIRTGPEKVDSDLYQRSEE